MRCFGIPFNALDAMSPQWFCNPCKAQRAPVAQRHGIFGPLLTRMERTNPIAFGLPDDIRDYFEGAVTADTGEYVEDIRRVAA